MNFSFPHVIKLCPDDVKLAGKSTISTNKLNDEMNLYDLDGDLNKLNKFAIDYEVNSMPEQGMI